MHSPAVKLLQTVWSAILAILILGVGQGIWGVVLGSNLRWNPAIPWSVPVMALVLWLMWQYLGGKWWPRSTSAARRRYLRADPVPGQVFFWSLLAGVLAIVALAGYWIVLFQLVRTPPNVLPDLTTYPVWSVASMVLMASLVSPVIEEAGFRGYCQVILEREFSPSFAVLISSFFFALAHLNQGVFWPKLLVYFLVGVTFGTIAYITQSTLPALAVHIIGDLIFFTVIWPNDATRRLLSEGGSDAWFWIHLAQAVVFTALAIATVVRLARVAGNLKGEREAAASV